MNRGKDRQGGGLRRKDAAPDRRLGHGDRGMAGAQRRG